MPHDTPDHDVDSPMYTGGPSHPAATPNPVMGGAHDPLIGIADAATAGYGDAATTGYGAANRDTGNATTIGFGAATGAAVSAPPPPTAGGVAPPSPAGAPPAAAQAVPQGMPAVPPTSATAGLQPGVISGPDGQAVQIISEVDYHTDIVREDHTLPLVVLGVGAFVTIVISAISAMSAGGVGGAVGATIGVGVMLVLATLLNTGVGWVVAKIFAADFGSGPVMLLRFGAVTSAYMAILGGLSLAIGGLFAMLFGFPALIILAVWLVGMELFQAVVFTIALALTNWLLTAFLLMSMASLIAM